MVLFSKMFEIGLLVLGFLYIGNMYLSTIVDIIQLGRDIDDDEKEKQKEKELESFTHRLYS